MPGLTEEVWGVLPSQREDAEDTESEQWIQRRMHVSKGREQRRMHESDGRGLRKSPGSQGGLGRTHGSMGSVGRRGYQGLREAGWCVHLCV